MSTHEPAIVTADRNSLAGRRSRRLSSERQIAGSTSLFLLSPLLLIYLIVFIAPVLLLLRLSLFDPDFTLKHYQLILEEPLYLRVIFRTIAISVAVAILTLLLGYPVALLMTRVRGWVAIVVTAGVLIPLWLSVLVRSYAWVVLLSRNGPIPTALRDLGLVGEDVRFMFTDGAVLLAMTHVLLPFMILPLYAALSAIRADFPVAARSLGASPLQAFWTVTLPLSLPGVFAGMVLVFVVALGFFVTPLLVGGPNSMLASMLITREATYGGNWGLAAALSTVLFAIAFSIVAIFGRTLRSPSQTGQA